MITIGPEELKKMPAPFAFGDAAAPEIPFSAETLTAHADTHILIFMPPAFIDGTPVTLNALGERMGVDPAVSEPCMYTQDWYLKEDFAANETTDGKWHLIHKDVLEEARAKRPEEIEGSLASEESFPSAITCAFAFFAYWFHTNGERLWNHDFVWCSDRDHNGDRIYVGRYEDPAGVNKNGFNIHRHLALRPSYSAAPEVVN
jgi:hypothetical protein